MRSVIIVTRFDVDDVFALLLLILFLQSQRRYVRREEGFEERLCFCVTLQAKQAQGLGALRQQVVRVEILQFIEV